jgi:hypothetical protein
MEGGEGGQPVSAIGRNQPCRCGSKKKTKHCCGVPHGPSDIEMAKAFLAAESRSAARRLVALRTAEVHQLFDEIPELPARHLSLQLSLPRLLTPELEALRHAIDERDTDAVEHQIEPALALIDKPLRRAELARAVLDLANAHVIDAALADVALLDLDLRSSTLVRASLLHALAVSIGASRTPSGLLVVSR